MKRSIDQLREMMMSNIKVDDKQCWNWTKYKDRRGYGYLNYGGKKYPAHRLSFILNIQKVDDKKFVCHKCDNPSCINPKHLFIGTAYENTMDAIKKGRMRTPYVRGDNHGISKLSSKDVPKIRNLYFGKGISQNKIAKKYNVTQSTISNLINKKVWGYL